MTETVYTVFSEQLETVYTVFCNVAKFTRFSLRGTIMRNKYRYTVYAQIETPDSIEYGCIEDQTCIDSGISLHEAFKTLWSTRTNMVDPAVETDCALTARGVSFLVVNGHEFETDCRETRMLNIFCTKSSAGRLMRLVASQ